MPGVGAKDIEGLTRLGQIQAIPVDCSGGLLVALRPDRRLAGLRSGFDTARRSTHRSPRRNSGFAQVGCIRFFL